MSELAVVRFAPVEWHVCEAAELLRAPLRDYGHPRRLLDLFDRLLLMASGKADYLETQLKNEVLGAVAFSPAATVYFALYGAAAIGDGFHGGTAGEPSGGAYDRVGKTNNTTNFATVADNVTKKNSTAITWAQATAAWLAGANLAQVGILDGNAKTSADNGYLWGDLTTPKPVALNDTAQFAVDALTYNED